MTYKEQDTRYCHMASISPNGIALYKEYIGEKRYRYNPDKDNIRANNINKPPIFKTPGGVMSRRARQRMEHAIKWLLFMSPKKKHYSRDMQRWIEFRLTFLTFTLSSQQKHTDQFIKSQCLNQLITELRREYLMRHYIWRAEKQANGNIHFHLVTNVFIPWWVIQAKWNRIQDKLGYIDSYTEKMRKTVHCFTDYYNIYKGQGSYMQLLKRYNQGISSGWRKPNSTDIHSLKKVKNVAAYLCKYMAKELPEGIREIEDIKDELLVNGKLWGLSESLSSFKKVSVPNYGKAEECVNEAFDKYPDRVYKGDYFIFVRVSLEEICALENSYLKNAIIEKVSELNKDIFT